MAGRSGDDALVARYDVNGRLDTSFGGGVVLLDTGGEEVALAVAVTANGKVVVGGRSYGSAAGVCCTMDALVARYRIDGTLDPSFGGRDGLVTVDLVPGPAEGGSDRFQALQVVPGDGVIAVGTNGGDIAMARLRPNGTLDGSFGTRGVVTADFNGWPERPSASARSAWSASPTVGSWWRPRPMHKAGSTSLWCGSRPAASSTGASVAAEW